MNKFEMNTQQFNNLPEGIMMDFEPYCSDCKAVSPEVLSDKIFVDNTTCVTHRITCQWRKQCKQLHKMVEAIPKADYENRLKADLVAMLTDIQLEIEEIKPLEPTDDEDWQYGCFHGLELMQDKCLKLIQQKINSLKEA